MTSQVVMKRRARIRISSEADAARSTIEAGRIAREIGFEPQDAQTISTAVSELVRNILKYAGTGEVLIDERNPGSRHGLQITVRDRGPGIDDVQAAMRDHFSSSGTLGLGLPGVQRMMDEFDIDSEPGRGTRVVIRQWLPKPGKDRLRANFRATSRLSETTPAFRHRQEAFSGEKQLSGLDCAFYIRPCTGERVSGDAVVIEERDGVLFMALIDALGHGPQANRVAQRATRVLKESWSEDLTATTQRLHEALWGSEGAAGALCTVDVETSRVRYLGVGNTVVRTIGTKGSRLYSAAGTLGHQMRTPREQRVALCARDLLVLYSDGVKERFELDDYPQHRYQKSRTIAKVIVDRFGKSHDDASCIVLRREP